MKYLDYEGLSRFWAVIKTALSNKLDKSGGKLSGALRIPYGITLRADDNLYYDSGIYVSTPGDEAVVHANKASKASWIFATADPATRPEWNDQTVVNGTRVQIKGSTLLVNKFVGSGTSPDISGIDCKGKIRATDTISTTGTISGSTLSGALGEANLTWGGKDFVNSFGPIDAAMVGELGANRLAFMPANAITIEYSTNDGQTWTDYGATDGQKLDLFNGNSVSLAFGKDITTNVDRSHCQLRITIDTELANVYTILNKFVVLVSTNGSYGCWCTIDCKTRINVVEDNDTWVTFKNKASIAGWSGYNVINTSDITTYGNSNYQYQKVRFTFGATSHINLQSPGLYVYKILGFGGVGWRAPSVLAKNGRIYSYDYAQNVTFPAKVSATSFNGYTINSNVPAKLTDALCSTASIVEYPATTAPTGWLSCNGATLSRTTYANLFTVIGTKYGVGNGSTTFQLPNKAGYIIKY